MATLKTLHPDKLRHFEQCANDDESVKMEVECRGWIPLRVYLCVYVQCGYRNQSGYVKVSPRKHEPKLPVPVEGDKYLFIFFFSARKHFWNTG